MRTLIEIAFMVVVAFGFWWQHHAAIRDVWWNQREAGLWALLLSRAWEVTETRCLLEASLTGATPASKRVSLDLAEVRDALDRAAAKPGDIVEFTVGFFPIGAGPGAALSVARVARAGV